MGRLQPSVCKSIQFCLMEWLLICVGIILSQTQISVAEWNQWLGADRDGISLEKGITQNWEEEGPVVAWRITLGEG